MTLGQSIKLHRNRAGLTQQALADKSGVSRSHLAAVEIGAYLPSLKLLEKISGPCGCSPTDFFDGVDYAHIR